MVTVMHDIDNIREEDSNVSIGGGGDEAEESTTMRNDDKQETAAAIGSAETNRVWRLKGVVTMVLVLATVGVASAVYHYTHRSEQRQFEDQFAEYAFKILEAIGVELDQVLGSLDSMVVGITSHTRASNQTWPNVQIPDFAIKAAKIRALSHVPIITLLPLVQSGEERTSWEAFAAANGPAWVDDALAVQATDEAFYGPMITNYSVNDVVHGNFGDIAYNETRDMLPTAQIYPMIPEYPPYNWDWLSILWPEGLYYTLDTKQVVLSAAWMLPDPNDPIQVEEMEIWADWYSDYLAPGLAPDEPISDIMMPIFDDGGQSVRIDTAEHKPVGMLMGNLYWRDVIRDILPEGSYVTVVMENPCNPSFTYMIKGPRTEYLGRGDLHQTQYDSMKQSSSIAELGSFRVDQQRSIYSGPPVDDEFCPFTVHVYPSSLMEDQYVTHLPIILTAVAVGIFLFTSLVFLWYDYTVETRQKVVLKTATQSTAVVESLFPEAVRDALYEQQQRQDNIGSSKEDAMVVGNRPEGVLRESKTLAPSPIATLYKETTIIFADLVGFTKWSAARTPSEVFMLLETIYGEFDRIARAKGVFKVETIGDSYVAVCGLPKPNKKHAMVMVKFASLIRDKMRQCTHELAGSLGEDTANLNLRIGLNSGATTAGVLRGEKSRFQLFGDSVNTASRMESNGTPGRIQVSESTAQKLMEAGKANWLTKREEMIEAKGKGLIQTWWAEPTVAASESARSAMSFGTGTSVDTSEASEADAHHSVDI
ncbi:Receptor-type guanylate cyclase gcy [Seminavis robusta]|uniref:Receptor-type guanylate cyclase gcy n=1 Tax=Seminavis robusta TaxID=568900 RepID=A0A9N8HVC9_9STRA|nr:Receptor-type guanylate cyclase gcy [Seminavis robusta]|eukprot:Sro1783_g297260.1 Receptor-type guanylate cyclase gcy (762) ;mRNA; r:12994-15389